MRQGHRDVEGEGWADAPVRPQFGLMVTSGVVGGGLPIAVGLALSCQLRGDRQVTVVNFGDGATSIGATHEACNLAALWAVPLVFVCQNNRTGSTPSSPTTPGPPAWPSDSRLRDGGGDGRREQRAGHGRRGRRAVARARSGGGPTFLECMTYRLGGHTFGATTEYMDPAEMAQAEADEPVARYRRWLVEDRGVDGDVLAGIDREVVDAVEAAFASAVAGEPPPADELLTDVFSTREAFPDDRRPGPGPSRTGRTTRSHHVRRGQPGLDSPWPRIPRCSSWARTSRTRSAG